ncbi:hypothetical protein BESB_066050 [Besnoitia besnoiti]|uniref:Uncharacterized protein n=1 Tax=Besnoitia besnoiti TaxID=94643 RepID=A0A2A9MGP7_BESBE|nr:hypothetical protein BESB_066050 [Besnoitia besnoiti]PFH34572.1 hypothetical protein BESB_066050 [Besnoitia besnoiti]
MPSAPASSAPETSAAQDSSIALEGTLNGPPPSAPAAREASAPQGPLPPSGATEACSRLTKLPAGAASRLPEDDGVADGENPGRECAGKREHGGRAGSPPKTGRHDSPASPPTFDAGSSPGTAPPPCPGRPSKRETSPKAARMASAESSQEPSLSPGELASPAPSSPARSEGAKRCTRRDGGRSAVSGSSQSRNATSHSEAPRSASSSPPDSPNSSRPSASFRRRFCSGMTSSSSSSSSSCSSPSSSSSPSPSVSPASSASSSASLSPPYAPALRVAVSSPHLLPGAPVGGGLSSPSFATPSGSLSPTLHATSSSPKSVSQRMTPHHVCGGGSGSPSASVSPLHICSPASLHFPASPNSPSSGASQGFPALPRTILACVTSPLFAPTATCASPPGMRLQSPPRRLSPMALSPRAFSPSCLSPPSLSPSCVSPQTSPSVHPISDLELDDFPHPFDAHARSALPGSPGSPPPGLLSSAPATYPPCASAAAAAGHHQRGSSFPSHAHRGSFSHAHRAAPSECPAAPHGGGSLGAADSGGVSPGSPRLSAATACTCCGCSEACYVPNASALEASPESAWCVCPCHMQNAAVKIDMCSFGASAHHLPLSSYSTSAEKLCSPGGAASPGHLSPSGERSPRRQALAGKSHGSPCLRRRPSPAPAARSCVSPSSPSSSVAAPVEAPARAEALASALRSPALRHHAQAPPRAENAEEAEKAGGGRDGQRSPRGQSEEEDRRRAAGEEGDSALLRAAAANCVSGAAGGGAEGRKSPAAASWERPLASANAELLGGEQSCAASGAEVSAAGGDHHAPGASPLLPEAVLAPFASREGASEPVGSRTESDEAGATELSPVAGNACGDVEVNRIASNGGLSVLSKFRLPPSPAGAAYLERTRPPTEESHARSEPASGRRPPAASSPSPSPPELAATAGETPSTPDSGLPPAEARAQAPSLFERLPRGLIACGRSPGVEGPPPAETHATEEETDKAASGAARNRDDRFAEAGGEAAGLEPPPAAPSQDTGDALAEQGTCDPCEEYFCKGGPARWSPQLGGEAPPTPPTPDHASSAFVAHQETTCTIESSGELGAEKGDTAAAGAPQAESSGAAAGSPPKEFSASTFPRDWRPAGDAEAHDARERAEEEWGREEVGGAATLRSAFEGEDKDEVARLERGDLSEPHLSLSGSYRDDPCGDERERGLDSGKREQSFAVFSSLFAPREPPEEDRTNASSRLLSLSPTPPASPAGAATNTDELVYVHLDPATGERKEFSAVYFRKSNRIRYKGSMFTSVQSWVQWVETGHVASPPFLPHFHCARDVHDADGDEEELIDDNEEEEHAKRRLDGRAEGDHSRFDLLSPQERNAAYSTFLGSTASLQLHFTEDASQANQDEGERANEMHAAFLYESDNDAFCFSAHGHDDEGEQESNSSDSSSGRSSESEEEKDENEDEGAPVATFDRATREASAPRFYTAENDEDDQTATTRGDAQRVLAAREDSGGRRVEPQRGGDADASRASSPPAKVCSEAHRKANASPAAAQTFADWVAFPEFSGSSGGDATSDVRGAEHAGSVRRNGGVEQAPAVDRSPFHQCPVVSSMGWRAVNGRAGDSEGVRVGNADGLQGEHRPANRAKEFWEASFEANYVSSSFVASSCTHPDDDVHGDSAEEPLSNGRDPFSAPLVDPFASWSEEPRKQ